MSTTPQGLLLVLGQCEPDVPTKDFNDWYDNEHAPARLTVPGITTAARYEAVDSTKPDWVAIYDLDTPSVAQSPEYLKLRETASTNEKALIPRLPILQRRIYSLEKEYKFTNHNKNDIPGEYLLIVYWSVPDEHVDEISKWYDEEHIPMVSQTPGWLRSRAYKLVDGVDLVPREGPPIGNYMFIHECRVGDYMESEAIQKSLVTPWSEKAMGLMTEVTRRQFKLHKSF